MLLLHKLRIPSCNHFLLLPLFFVLYCSFSCCHTVFQNDLFPLPCSPATTVAHKSFCATSAPAIGHPRVLRQHHRKAFFLVHNRKRLCDDWLVEHDQCIKQPITEPSTHWRKRNESHCHSKEELAADRQQASLSKGRRHFQCLQCR